MLIMRLLSIVAFLFWSCAALAQMPAVNTTPTGCGTTGWPLVAGSPMQCALPPGPQSIIQAKAVVLGSGTGDKATISVPTTITRYQIIGISTTNCSVTPILAAFGVWTGAGGTGTSVVAATTITGATGTTVILNSTLAGSVATTMLTAASLFVNVTVANAAALTCDIGVKIQDWS